MPVSRLLPAVRSCLLGLGLGLAWRASAPSVAYAQDPVPPTVAPTVLVEPSHDARGDGDGAHARQTLRTFAENEHDGRMAGGFALLVAGGAAVGAGLVTELHFDQSYGRIVWIGGALTAVSGFSSLFRPGPLESLDLQTAGGSAGELRRQWGARAAAARSGRVIGGVVTLVVGAAAAGVGGALGAGMGDLTQDAREAWTLGLLVGGGAFMASGLSTLLLESTLEHAFRTAYGSPAPRVSLVPAPVAGGGTLALSGRF